MPTTSFLIYFIALLCIIFPLIKLLFFTPPSYFRPKRTFDPALHEVSCPVDDPNRFNTVHRTVFGPGAATVRGFPSTGGLLILPLDFAIVSYLDLPRLSTVQRAADADEEDEFCIRLRLLGAKWWADQEDMILKELGAFAYEPEMQKELVVGWPTAKSANHGGVWVLRAQSQSELPDDFSMLGMCVDMDERCDLLERWNATFYEDPAAVPEFEKYLMKGVNEGWENGKMSD